MVKVKFDTMEISCNHDAAEYLCCLCESALRAISDSGSDSQYRKCDNFIKAIYSAIDADIVKISYEEYRDLLIAMHIYSDYQHFNSSSEECANSIIYLLWNGVHNRKTKEIIFCGDDFANIIRLLRYVYESENFEYHHMASSRVVADFYEKYKAAL